MLALLASLGACAASPGAGRVGTAEPACSDAAECTERCDAGNARSCMVLGAMHAAGRGAPRDLAKASALLEKACTLREREACWLLGAMLHEGRYVARDDRRALGVFQGLCDRGDAAGCSLVGLVHWNGRGVPKDRERAHALFAKACGAGDRFGCVLERMAIGDAAHGPPDARTLEHAGALCDLGVGIACGWLGTVHQNGEGVPKDGARAAGFFRRGCDGGSPASCAMLGLTLLEGPHGGGAAPQDQARGRALIEQACDAGYDPACVVSGLAYEQGAYGAVQDDARALARFRSACDKGNDEGCTYLAIFLYRGRGIPRDVARARALLTGACQDGLGEACGKLGAIQLESGETGAAGIILRRGCELGDQPSCTLLEAMSGGPP